MKKVKKQRKITVKIMAKIKSQKPMQAKGYGKVAPLSSWVLVKPFTKEELEKKNSFGIILPDTDKKEKSERGVVLAVGVGGYQDGKFVPMSVKVGSTVIFSKYGYEDVTVDGEELYLIKEENILAILK